MKNKNYLKLLLFLTPLLVLFVSGEFLIRQIPNDYRYKNEFLSKNSRSIETLILGGSHTHTGVDPEVFVNFHI